LTFSLDKEQLPTDDEVESAVSLTRTYLNGFFKQRVSPALQALDTRLVEGSYFPASTFRMNLSSTALFETGAASVLSLEELELLLSLSLSGDNLHILIGLLQQLPENNIFSSTIDVSDSTFRVQSDGDNDPIQQGSSNVAIGSSLAAGTFILLLVGVSVYRRREPTDKAHRVAGTVAGNTYAMSTLEETIHQQIRFPDDNHSEWAMSTHANTDADSISGHESINCPSMRRLHCPIDDFGELHPCDSLAQPIVMHADKTRVCKSASISDDSEDTNVPTRVVDLIKMFSPSRYPSGGLIDREDSKCK
jgi:hypothetical protein